MQTSWHVATAVEAITAAQFARLGFDVSVQYGANQPEYDLIVAEGDRILKISVKGSSDGGWGLSQGHLARLRNANYQGVADAWLTRHYARVRGPLTDRVSGRQKMGPHKSAAHIEGAPPYAGPWWWGRLSPFKK